MSHRLHALKFRPWRPNRKRGVHKHRRQGRWAHLKELLWPSMGLMAWFRWVWLVLLRQAEDPHHVALGFAFGTWVSFFPILGTHMPLSFLMCWVFRGSYLAAFGGMFVGNTWTFPLIWSMDYKLGIWLLGWRDGAHKLNLGDMSLSHMIDNIETIGKLWLFPTAVGGLLLGVVAGGIAYELIRVNVLLWHKRKAALRLLKKELALVSKGLHH